MGVTADSMGSGFWVPIPPALKKKKKTCVLHFPNWGRGKGSHTDVVVRAWV